MKPKFQQDEVKITLSFDWWTNHKYIVGCASETFRPTAVASRKSFLYVHPVAVSQF